MGERLDEERLELLRQWGVGLSSATRDELRAAGRAILLLIEEIERLQVDVWNARVGDVSPSETELEATLQARVASARAPESG